MKPYLKKYRDFFGIGENEPSPCERCWTKADQVHHIKCKGIGGNKNLDDIENLIGVCQICHIAAHSDKTVNHVLELLAQDLDRRKEEINKWMRGE